eukprot:scaffold1584_cov259-Pinguiococcus_pyrenoidosus.AAC.3
MTQGKAGFRIAQGRGGFLLLVSDGIRIASLLGRCEQRERRSVGVATTSGLATDPHPRKDSCTGSS